MGAPIAPKGDSKATVPALRVKTSWYDVFRERADDALLFALNYASEKDFSKSTMYFWRANSAKRRDKWHQINFGAYMVGLA